MVDASSVIIDVVATGVDKASADIKRFGNTFEQSGKQVSRAANDVDRSAARIQNGTRNVGRNIADIGTQLSGGQSPFLILAQQAPQLADALVDTGGRLARFATFFVTPMGAALLAVGSILGTLAPQLLGFGDAADKAKKNADGLKIATDGLGDKTLKASAATKLLNEAYAADKTKVIANDARGAAQARLEQANATYAAARAEAQLRLTEAQGRQRVAANGGPTTGRAGGRLSDVRGRAGSELSRFTQQASTDAQKAQADLESLDKAYDRFSNLQVKRLLQADESLRSARISSAAATDAVTKAQERRNFVERENQILLDAKKITEAQATARLKEANQAVDVANAAARQGRKDLTEHARAVKVAAASYADFVREVRNAPLELEKLSREMAKKPIDEFLPISANPELPSWADTRKRLKEDDEARTQSTLNNFNLQRDKEKELQRVREQNVKSIASLLEAGLTGGAKGFGDALEQAAIRFLAKLAASKIVSLLGSVPQLASLFGGGLSVASPSAASLSGTIASLNSGIKFRAAGGPVAAGETYVVGERGPELLRMGGQGGTVVPNHAIAAQGGGNTYYISVSADNSVTPAGFASDLAGKILAQAKMMDAVAADAGANLGMARMQRRANYQLGRR
ncbi:MAG: phage tail length tape measure family protein [Devosia sp.]|uniref:phage tail length tape measure family protein n=1 Tax=Devosia sp. TaxID=1871048 RepID=UPI0033955869